MLEHGAYTLLLEHYYAEELPIPLDMVEVYTMVRAMTTADRKAVDKVLARYFTRRDDGFHNARADEEIAIASKIIDTAKENGKLGGRPRKTQIETEEVTETITKNGTGTVTHEEPANNHPPTPILQPPASIPQPPTAKKPPSDAARRSADEVQVALELWAAYARAYQGRYGVAPVRNAKVNGMLARFLQRVPMVEAPDIAAFYVGHNKGLYVSAKHCVDLLLRDAEGLRTEWATNRPVTDAEARQTDRTAATGSQVDRLLAEAKKAA